jgi:3-hydroxyacyl-[acyl-carrier-protein] dehydratase
MVAGGSFPSSETKRGAHTPTFAAPLRLVDVLHVERLGDVVQLEAVYRVSSDPPMDAHFPGFPIFPGVFIVESLRQALAAITVADRGLEFSALQSVRFLAPLRPDDTLRLRAVVRATAASTFEVSAECHNAEGLVVARMKVECRAGQSPPPQAYDQSRLRRMLPHGHPMLLLDRVESLDPDGSIRAVKAVTATEPCYRHVPSTASPEDYAYPTALVLESFGQAAAVLWFERAGRALREDEAIVLAGIRKARVEGHAYPGDVLRHVARIDNIVADNVFVEGETWVADRRILSVESMIAAVRRRTAATALV